MTKGSRRSSNDRKAELSALEELPDDRINTADVPELLDWSDARRGVFCRPSKQQVTLRLDEAVISPRSDKAR